MALRKSKPAAIGAAPEVEPGGTGAAPEVERLVLVTPYSHVNPLTKVRFMPNVIISQPVDVWVTAMMDAHCIERSG